MELRNDSAAYEEGVVAGQTIPCAVFYHHHDENAVPLGDFDLRR